MLKRKDQKIFSYANVKKSYINIRKHDPLVKKALLEKKDTLQQDEAAIIKLYSFLTM